MSDYFASSPLLKLNPMAWVEDPEDSHQPGPSNRLASPKRPTPVKLYCSSDDEPDSTTGQKVETVAVEKQPKTMGRKRRIQSSSSEIDEGDCLAEAERKIRTKKARFVELEASDDGGSPDELTDDSEHYESSFIDDEEDADGGSKMKEEAAPAEEIESETSAGESEPTDDEVEATLVEEKENDEPLQLESLEPLQLPPLSFNSKKGDTSVEKLLTPPGFDDIANLPNITWRESDDGKSKFRVFHDDDWSDDTAIIEAVKASEEKNSAAETDSQSVEFVADSPLGVDTVHKLMHYSLRRQLKQKMNEGTVIFEPSEESPKKNN